ncbi:unnamed protein product [Dovyalis caffra]|uniref:Pentatricopeptide repeat-containing protein n=1 Tax=Dovyalis caffra TaxID=77055 RepID=A0AAV1S2X8_9ROSI|nr:unnamed protein product [Dovyalis caffra]
MGVLELGDLKESLGSVWVLRRKESGGLRRIGGFELKIEGEYKRRVDIEAISCVRIRKEKRVDVCAANGEERCRLRRDRFIHTASSLDFSSYAYSIFASITHSLDIYLYGTIIDALLALLPTSNLISFFTITSNLLGYDSTLTHSLSPSRPSLDHHLSLPEGNFTQSIRFGHHSHLHIVIALVRMYSSFGSPSIFDAHKRFDEMSMTTKDMALWNTMFNGYAKLGDLRSARAQHPQCKHSR